MNRDFFSLNPFLNSQTNPVDKSKPRVDKNSELFSKQIKKEPSGLLSSDKNTSFDEFVSQSSTKTNPFDTNVNKIIKPSMKKQTAQAQSVSSKTPLNKNFFIESLASSLVDLIDLKDAYTGAHSKEVKDYSLSLAKEINLPDSEIEAIGLGSVFHDIGKIGVPESILNKQSTLTNEEFEEIKKHPVAGSNIIKNIPSFKGSVSDIIRNHHENWDGSGYPDGLAGNDIPIGARIVSVADSYHAMISDRPYRKGMPTEKAFSILQNGAGSQWDPVLVEKFLGIINSKK